MPAAVGVVQQAGLIAANWLAISAALIVSTLLTLIVTVYTFRAVARRIAEARAMTAGDNLYRIWVFLSQTPLLWLTATLARLRDRRRRSPPASTAIRWRTRS